MTKQYQPQATAEASRDRTEHSLLSKITLTENYYTRWLLKAKDFNFPFSPFRFSLFMISLRFADFSKCLESCNRSIENPNS